MDDAEVARLLKERGYTLGSSAVREDGVFLWQVNETFMFRRDAVDIASGACALSDVIAVMRAMCSLPLPGDRVPTSCFRIGCSRN